jgi:hypothetical protein
MPIWPELEGVPVGEAFVSVMLILAAKWRQA